MSRPAVCVTSVNPTRARLTRHSFRFVDYDLVRIYHPDSPSARAGGISPETAHARFQAISTAYAVLSGKKPASAMNGDDVGEAFGAATRPSYHDLSTAMWRARQRRKADLDIGLDERWKERLMAGAILLVSPLAHIPSTHVCCRTGRLVSVGSRSRL